MPVTIQWTPERLSAFKSEIDRARKARKHAAETYDWDGNLKRYVPLPAGSGDQKRWDVNVGVDFQTVERKKAALFYDTPAVSFIPEDASAPVGPPSPPPGEGQPPPPAPMTFGTLCYLHQRLVNGLLSHQYADAKRVVSKVLFDTLCASGFGLIQVGYDVVTVDVPAPVQMDPLTGMPLESPPVPVPVHEDWYLARVSPYAELLPADHRDTDIDSAPWVGYDFEWPLSEVRRRFKLPPDWKPKAGGGSEEKPYYKDDLLSEQDTSNGKEVVVCGSVIQYRMAALSGPTDQAPHPLAIADLVLIDGEDEQLKHEASPCQTIGDDARMTPDSVTEFMLKRLTLRDRTDQAYVPSDCTVTAPLVKELNKYRSITVRNRDANFMAMLYDPEKLNPEVKEKLDKGQFAIPLEPGMLDGGIDKVAAQIGQVTQSRENWTGQDYIERDIERMHGIGANQVGQQSANSKTATEVQTVQRNTEARFEQERQRVLEWYVDVVRVFDALVLRYADERTAVKVLGLAAGQAWAANKQALAGMYRYEIQIDSGKYLDVEANKRQLTQLLNMVGQSQHVNIVPVLKKIATAYGIDPAQMVIDQPPKAQPDPPKVNVTVSADHLNPALPQFKIVLEILAQGGYVISPEAIAAATAQAQIQATVQGALGNTIETPTPQPGTAAPQITETLPKMPTLNQHQSEETGNLTGPV
jgi:hypothetical protein